MQVTLLVVLVCACAAATLALPSSNRQPRSPQPEEKNKDGGWAVGADTTRNGGTVVRAEGNKKWDVTNDGRVQAEVHGHWERTYGGPNNGQRDRGVGGSIGGSWGK
ncbi:uncharacterized protein LOC124355868 [Homalodisca vitripennis]|uniref:uncharacterized protein LOC124355868 n=1 Tax=Homalodisca vitripennis TaxID=197043 RepID=UPI001EEABFA3|nr:uncharacterized protein LOC124355868 [Homalodisca vitripennis]KAG8302730.1 hypothetical protein J6590_026933 [Homalodisca vitripennis]